MPSRWTIRCSATGMINALEHQGDQRGDVEVRRILDVRLPGNGERQDDGVRGEDVEQRVHPVLVEQASG